MFERIWLLGVALALGCESGSVGDPCVPDVEYAATFAPFSMREVYLESRSFECATRLCLVNHFQGRVSCPLGQAGPEGAPACFLPSASAGDAEQRVQTPVPAWDLDRPASRAVYCSCRCAGPDPDARYCECPSGFQCRELAPELDAPNAELAGSYCIKRGSEFDPVQVGGATCADVPSDPRCAE
ncbi:MAG TPA: hypothetical protein VGP93_03645 [Polyangiaceae bacterium]|jgi:hypothetical protein|nr:hypothetical protein [Polyangiaceae bacterium]